MAKAEIDPLVELGFTRLESEVYTYLLGTPRATGYAVAKGIRKPTANTYKALESLYRKGAIIIDDGESKACRAVHPDELLEGIRRRLTGSIDRAKTGLRGLVKGPGDNRIYQLQTVEQVFSRYRAMLSECAHIALLDFFPFVVDELRDDMISAAKRGVRVILRLYEPSKLPGVGAIVAPESKRILKVWPGCWANGVVDGQEYLLSYFSKDAHEVYQAVWSNNHFLSWIYYDALVNEITFSALRQGINDGMNLSQCKTILKEYQHMFSVTSQPYKGASSFLASNPHLIYRKRNEK